MAHNFFRDSTGQQHPMRTFEELTQDEQIRLMELHASIIQLVPQLQARVVAALVQSQAARDEMLRILLPAVSTDELARLSDEQKTDILIQWRGTQGSIPTPPTA